MYRAKKKINYAFYMIISFPYSSPHSHLFFYIFFLCISFSLFLCSTSREYSSHKQIQSQSRRLCVCALNSQGTRQKRLDTRTVIACAVKERPKVHLRNSLLVSFSQTLFQVCATLNLNFEIFLFRNKYRKK